MKRGSLFFAAGVLAASGPCFGVARTYEVEIVNTWSSATHPGAYPGGGHFTPFAGAVHSDQAVLWEIGTPASPGLKQLAETGSNPTFTGEAQAAVNAGTALSVIQRSQWVCSPDTNSGSCGPGVFFIEVDLENPRVTLASMIGPSPDWFTGVSGFSLRASDVWIEEAVVDLRPHDAGTRSNNNTFNLFGPLNNPPEPVSLITDKTGQIITGASVGSMTFRLLPPVCPGDLDGDAMTGGSDLAALLAGWGQPGDTDLNNDGTTDGADLAALLAAWGSCS